MVTRCDECYEDADDTLEIAKFAVERITKNFDSNKWALQHIAKAQTKVTNIRHWTQIFKPITSKLTCTMMSGGEGQVHCVQLVAAHVGDLVPSLSDQGLLRPLLGEHPGPDQLL